MHDRRAMRWAARGAVPGADGVDGHLPALGTGDGLLESYTARVVFAIANDHKYPGNRLFFRMVRQFAGSEGNRVPQSRSPAGCKLADGATRERLICGEILHTKHRAVDANDEGKIVLVRDHRLQELAGGRPVQRKSGRSRSYWYR